MAFFLKGTCHVWWTLSGRWRALWEVGCVISAWSSFQVFFSRKWIFKHVRAVGNSLDKTKFHNCQMLQVIEVPNCSLFFFRSPNHTHRRVITHFSEVSCGTFYSQSQLLNEQGYGGNQAEANEQGYGGIKRRNRLWELINEIFFVSFFLGCGNCKM